MTNSIRAQSIVGYLVLIAFSFLCLYGAHPAQSEESAAARTEKKGVINCGYFVWPPYVVKDANTGKLSGINYDIMEAIGRNLGVKIVWGPEVGAGEAAAALNAQKFDVMCASVWQSPGRMQTMTLTQPTFYSPAFVFARADDHRFDADFSKANNPSVKVAAIDGDYSYDLAREVLPNAAIVSLPMSASGSELMLQVVTRKADIIMSDVSVVNDFMKTNPNSFHRVGSDKPIRVYGELLAVKRGEYQLRDMLNQAILQLGNDGIIGDILKKYSARYNAIYYPPASTYISLPYDQAVK